MKMYSIKKIKSWIVCLTILLVAFTIFTACASFSVTWLDADGTVLYTESTSKNDEIPQKNLPPDTDQWHYTGWQKITSDKKGVTFLAERVAKSHVIWLDADESVLYEEYALESEIQPKPLPEDTQQWHYTRWRQRTFGSTVTYVAERIANQIVTWLDADGTCLAQECFPIGQNIPQKELPADTDQWSYTGWSKTNNGNEYTYVAEREPKKDYFVGNVFQIIIKDLAGNPLGTGTGFVFDESGLFITNAHVMKNAYQAVGIFEIRDSTKGESFTTLEITKASYIHYDKDIFIGKLDNYSKIARYYEDIPFQTSHSVGDVTYSVGYPNSSVSMQINKGEIKKDLSSLYDKLYSGVSYIASSSYIAPGSSGGILINGDAEVIGMTTLGWFDGADNFILGAAIEAYNYTSLTSNAKSSRQQDIAFFLHPEDKTFIKFFRDFIAWSNTKEIVDDGMISYKCTWESEEINDNGVAYSYEESLYVSPDGFICYIEDVYWADGDHLEILFYGQYSALNELDNFIYEFKYTWGNGKWHSLKSTNINYSENLNLTLRDYTSNSSYGYSPSKGNINYAKKEFNTIYEWLYEMIEEYK